MPVYDWVRDLIACERLPRIFVVDRVPRRLEGAAEDFWISYYLDHDAPILNVSIRLANPVQYLDWLDQRAAADLDWLDKIGHRVR